MSDRNDELQALLDRDAIRELPVRYCDCVWQDDLDGLLKLFARDGEFIIVNGSKRDAAQGAGMRKMYKQGLAIGPRPYIHNHVVFLDDATHAHGRCYLALHSIKQNMQFIGAGYYNDSYVKDKGVWKFARREFIALRIDDDPMAQPKRAPAAKKKPAVAKKKAATTRKKAARR